MKADVVIIGGGVIGSAIACYLASCGERSIIVIERDPSYARASSALSASSIRQQFTTPLSIEMSRYGFEYLSDVHRYLAFDGEAPDIGLVEQGYLYLAERGKSARLEAALRIQQANKAPVIGLSTEKLKARYSWLHTEDLGYAALGTAAEGWFDGYSLMQAFRRKARALGVRYLHDEAVGFALDGASVCAVATAESGPVTGDVFVNAGGPHAARISDWADFTLPVKAEKHTIFAFSCPDPILEMPLIVDPSGLYVRPEGKGYIAGGPVWSPDSDPEDLEPDYLQFDEFTWPTLAQRIPKFERIRMTRAWAGHYEMCTFDHNALIGWTPGVDNLIVAAGFSGHGMQHAPAAGRGVAELILHDRYQTIDLSSLSPERLVDGRPIEELNII